MSGVRWEVPVTGMMGMGRWGTERRAGLKKKGGTWKAGGRQRGENAREGTDGKDKRCGWKGQVRTKSWGKRKNSSQQKMVRLQAKNTQENKLGMERGLWREMQARNRLWKLDGTGSLV